MEKVWKKCGKKKRKEKGRKRKEMNILFNRSYQQNGGKIKLFNFSILLPFLQCHTGESV